MNNKSQSIVWVVVALSSIILGTFLGRLNLPANWILAAIICSAFAALRTGHSLKLNQQLFDFGRGCIGIIAAVPLTLIDGLTFMKYVIPGIATAIATVGLSIGFGVLLSRVQYGNISRRTGVLSTLPGGASLMPALAAELEVNYQYVVLNQYLRLLVVSMSLPIIAALLVHPQHGTAPPAQGSPNPVIDIALCLIIVYLGGWAGRRLHLPAPQVFGPLALTIVVSIVLPNGFTVHPPHIFSVLAFLAIGWMCGGGLSKDSLREFSKQLPVTICFVILILGCCALIAIPVATVLDVTYFEAYLATSPGALETVLALANEGGAGAVVVVFQIVRLLIVLVCAANLPFILRKLRIND